MSYISDLLRDNKTGQVSTSNSLKVGAFAVASVSILWLAYKAGSAIGESLECKSGMTQVAGIVTSVLTGFSFLLGGYVTAFVMGSLGSKAINATAAVKTAQARGGDNLSPPMPDADSK